MNPCSKEFRPLDVLVSRTLAADGSESTHGVVACARRDHTVSTSECARCEEYRGTVEECGALELLCAHRGRALPMLPPAGLRRDPSLAEATPITEIAKSVVCLKRDVPVALAAQVMLELGVSGLPVVGSHDELVGIVSKTDLVQYAWRPMTPARCGRVEVDHIMSRDPVSISEKASIARASELMIEEGVHRLPIVDEKGAVLGIVTPFDVLEWLAR
jgi:CBS domain-containing protein